MHKYLLIPAALLLAACTSTDQIVSKAINLANAGHYSEAIPLYQEAAEDGNSMAQLQLAKCYDFGKGVTPDMHQAAAWYTLAAEGGNSNAQYRFYLFLQNDIA